MSFRTRTSCRVCSSRSLSPVLSLGETAVSDFVDLDAPEQVTRVPLDLVLCGDCSLLQLRHTTDPSLLWTHYWYRSGTNLTMRNALAEISSRAREVVECRPGDLVLDIGCNDGTLLRSYGRSDLRTVGFEPAANLAPDASKGNYRIINDYFNYPAFQREFGAEKARIITSISMFYDLEEPNRFVADVKKCLAHDGLWIIQMNYLVSMMNIRAYDNIGHEHLEYYSLLSLTNLLDRHGFEVFDVELTELNGGSIRTFIRNRGAEVPSRPGAEQRLEAIRAEEARLALHKIDSYREFASQVEELREELVGFVNQEIAKGATIYVYGASTRGSTLLQYCGLDNRVITAAAERSPYKFGKKTSGTWIPIVSEDEARAARPDYFLILPYFFLKEFLSRESEYLMDGGKFIVPMPEFRVIGKEHPVVREAGSLVAP